MPLIWLMQTNERTKQKTARRRTHWKEQKITHTNAKGRSEYVREKSLFVNDKENLEFKFSSIDCLSFHHLLSLALSLCVFIHIIRCDFTSRHTQTRTYLMDRLYYTHFHRHMCELTAQCIRLYECVSAFAFVFVRMCIREPGCWATVIHADEI